MTQVYSPKSGSVRASADHQFRKSKQSSQMQMLDDIANDKFEDDGNRIFLNPENDS